MVYWVFATWDFVGGTMNRSLAPILATLAVLGSPLACHAVDVINTGIPTGSVLGLSGAGATFSVSSSTALASVQAYFDETSFGLPTGVTVSIFNSSTPGTPASPLFSAQSTVPAYGVGWFGVQNVAWTLPAGTYAVAFTTSGFFGMSMRTGTPHPLASEWILSGGTWTADPLDIGVLASTAAPVPDIASSYASLGGLLAVLFVWRSRRPRASLAVRLATSES